MSLPKFSSSLEVWELGTGGPGRQQRQAIEDTATMTGSREDQFIEALKRRLASGREARPQAQSGILGIGDDAACIPQKSGFETVWTVDSQVEHVHFRRSWAPLPFIGRRAVGAALSDLAAMGALAQGVLLDLHRPKDLSNEALDAIMEGLIEALESHGVPLLGGNLSSSSCLALSVSALGAVERGQALRRDRAAANARLFLSRRPGAASLALAALEGRLPGAELEAEIESYLAPKAELKLGRDLVALSTKRGLATSDIAAMDLTDGLFADLQRLSVASERAFELDWAALETPRWLPHWQALKLTREQFLGQAAEEYSLLVAAPESLRTAMLELGFIEFGGAIDGPPRLLDSQGQVLTSPGFDHFSG